MSLADMTAKGRAVHEFFEADLAAVLEVIFVIVHDLKRLDSRVVFLNIAFSLASLNFEPLNFDLSSRLFPTTRRG